MNKGLMELAETGADWSECDQPSSHGAALGKLLSAMVQAGGGAEMCATCAFREGSMPNRMAGTGLIAMHCAMGTDPSPFGCHHGMQDGEPSRLCAGALAASRATLEQWKVGMGALIGALPSDGVPDPIRDDFNAWREQIDPAGALDVYQLGRAYALRAKAVTGDDNE